MHVAERIVEHTSSEEKRNSGDSAFMCFQPHISMPMQSLDFHDIYDE